MKDRQREKNQDSREVDYKMESGVRAKTKGGVGGEIVVSHGRYTLVKGCRERWRNHGNRNEESAYQFGI